MSKLSEIQFCHLARVARDGNTVLWRDVFDIRSIELKMKSDYIPFGKRQQSCWTAQGRILCWCKKGRGYEPFVWFLPDMISSSPTTIHHDVQAAFLRNVLEDCFAHR